METAIYGTIGPGCDRAETLTAMFESGMTGVRINLSHSGLWECRGWLEQIERAAEAVGRRPRLLMDLQGPELRIGACREKMLEEGQKVVLCPEPEVLQGADCPEPEVLQGADCPKPEVQRVVRCPEPEVEMWQIPVPFLVCQNLKNGQEILFDDGKLLLLAEESGKEGGVCRVLRGGRLKPRKSIALPGTELYPPTLTASDLRNIGLIRECGITGVMLPFVREEKDIENLRNALKNAGAGETEIFAKIENMRGVEALSKLMQKADQIVIARGDLGNDMPPWKLPVVQSRIAAACRKVGKPFMVVTQMLASMENCPVPTRAETSDIFRAVMEGAAGVMLTGETAAGRYPAEAMECLCNTVRETEAYRQEIRIKNSK